MNSDTSLGPDFEIIHQLFLNGPTMDGDMVSKNHRDDMVVAGFVERYDGWNWLTTAGVRQALTMGMDRRKEVHQRNRANALAAASHGSVHIICGFPGVGKSHYVRTHPGVMDSDSSTFPKSGFPDNYLGHLEQCHLNGQTVLASSHEEVRSGLMRRGIPFSLVYPDRRLKAEYMERYRERGSPEAFLSLMDKNWDQFVESCRRQRNCTSYTLYSGQYIGDVL